MRRNLCGFLLLALAPWAWAQAESAEGPPQVTLDVVIRGSQGFPENLKASDFSIFDNGEKVLPNSARIMRWIPEEGELRRRSGAANAAKSPGTLSNNLDYRGDGPTQVTVLLWDLLNTSIEQQASAREQVFGLYGDAKNLPPFGLYSLVKSAEILTDFNGDPREVHEAIREISKPPSAGGFAVPVNTPPPPVANPARMNRTEERLRELANYNEVLLPDVDFYSNRDRVLLALESLRNMAEHLHGIPGRKNIVWLADTFPEIPEEIEGVAASRIDSLNIPLQLQLTVEALNEANVAVYPIWLGQATGTGTMDLLASRTGGRAIQNVTDLRDTLTGIRNDTAQTYRLTFTPIKRGGEGGSDTASQRGISRSRGLFERAEL